MKIPKKLKIGNLMYDFKFADDSSIERCGRSGLKKQQIRINSDISQELIEETFIHETIHQILDQKSFSDESANEKLVDTLSCGIYQVFKDNQFLR